MNTRFEEGRVDKPLALTPSGVRNILSFLFARPTLLLLEKSCHFDFPASSSRLALTLRGTLAGRTGPSLTLLGSLRAWFASAGLISAAAEMMLELTGLVASVCADGVPGVPSALRLRESPLLEMGLMSFAFKVSVVP